MRNKTKLRTEEDITVAEKKQPDAGQQPGTAIVKIAEEALLAVNEQTVTAFLNDKLTKPEMALFLNLCAMFQLNPFKREVYPIKYKAGEAASFVIGYETYLKRAERAKNWAGLETGAELGEDDLPKKAWARVFRKDWGDRPLFHEVYYREYVQLKSEYVQGQPTGRKIPNKMWSEKPITMLKKVAIAQAMRMAFPDDMAGLPYIEEELHLGEPGSIEAKAEELKQRAEYEASKGKVGNVKDEFTNPEDHPIKPEPAKPAPEAPKPAPPVAPKPAPAAQGPQDPGHDPDLDLRAEAEDEPKEQPAGPNLKQLEKFAKLKTDLKGLGVDEDRMWGGIKKFCLKTLEMTVEETGDLDEPKLEMVLGYLHRWRGALQKEKAEREAQGGK